MRLEGWNCIPEGYGASFDVAAAPVWLRLWYGLPVADRFAYPRLVARGYGWLVANLGASADEAAALARGWRIRPPNFVQPGSVMTLKGARLSRRRQRLRLR